MGEARPYGCWLYASSVASPRGYSKPPAAYGCCGLGLWPLRCIAATGTLTCAAAERGVVCPGVLVPTGASIGGALQFITKYIVRPSEVLTALPWMLCDVRIRGVEDLFDDQVEVYGEMRCSELGKASDFCSAKARSEMIIRIGRMKHTTTASQPRPAGWNSQ